MTRLSSSKVSTFTTKEPLIPSWTNQRPVASHWQTLSHNVVSNTLRYQWGSNSNVMKYYIFVLGLHIWSDQGVRVIIVALIAHVCLFRNVVAMLIGVYNGDDKITELRIITVCNLSTMLWWPDYRHVACFSGLSLYVYFSLFKNSTKCNDY
jgi:hypothetical protein